MAEAYRFDFFQAVRILQRMGREGDARGLAGHPVGEDHAPKEEVVRFRTIASHSFPTGAISAIRTSAKKTEGAEGPPAGPPEMTVACLGLTGPQGVLPDHYTALLISRVRGKDYALRDFFDLFNHRTISLFYRAWEKYRFPLAYERSAPAQEDAGEDLFTHVLYSLVGMGTPALRGRMAFDDEALLYYGGHFAHHPPSAVSLAMIVGDYFELAAEVRQFQGQWLYLDRDDLSQTPSRTKRLGQNNRLGDNLVVGERVWDVQGKFRLRLGPLSYRQFCRFIPSGDALKPLCQMVRQYVGGQFDFDVQPVLLKDEVPKCRLGADGSDPARLGWNTWIRSKRFEYDVDDAVFSLEG
jgi:type VI secretion system protein ImpH